MYDTSPHYIEIKPDSLISPQEVAQSLEQLNLMHNNRIATKLKQECVDLATADAAGQLEWIDYQPFITLAKDSPLNACFGAPLAVDKTTLPSQLSFDNLGGISPC